MGILILGGEDDSFSVILAALEGRRIDYRTEDGSERTDTAFRLVGLLDEDQKKDFIELRRQGYVVLPEGIKTNRFGDVGLYLLTLTPEEFKKFYLSASLAREKEKGVRKILEIEN